MANPSRIDLRRMWGRYRWESRPAHRFRNLGDAMFPNDPRA